MDPVKLSARVTGRVQGVGFRRYVERNALELGLAGYTRNQPDRSVEVVAEGNRAAIEELIRRLIQGPTLSRVDDVQTDFTPGSGDYQGFEIR